MSRPATPESNDFDRAGFLTYASRLAKGPVRLSHPSLRSVSRSTVAVAVCVATAAALGFSAPRPGDSARDLAVRLTRSGPQRLDAPEAIPHSHEESEPESVFSSLVLDVSVGAAQRSNADAPDVVLAALPASILRLQQAQAWTPVTPHDPPLHAPQALTGLPPGRAPPAS